MTFQHYSHYLLLQLNNRRCSTCKVILQHMEVCWKYIKYTVYKNVLINNMWFCRHYASFKHIYCWDCQAETALLPVHWKTFVHCNCFSFLFIQTSATAYIRLQFDKSSGYFPNLNSFWYKIPSLQGNTFCWSSSLLYLKDCNFETHLIWLRLLKLYIRLCWTLESNFLMF